MLDLECARETAPILRAVREMVRLGRGSFGVRLGLGQSDLADAVLAATAPAVGTVVAPVAALAELEAALAAFRRAGGRVLAEVGDAAGAAAADGFEVSGLIAKGLEAGGWIGEETTFILLQRLLAARRPVWAHGGIGLHTAAACLAAGATGVVLDLQLALTRESALPAAVRAAIGRMDGSETVVLGDDLGAPMRAFAWPGLAVLEELRALADRLRDDPRPESERRAEWTAAVRARTGWRDGQLWPVGQDGAFAAGLARRFVTVGGVVAALRDAAEAHVEAAARQAALGEGAPLAASHGTRFPIVQGPMTRVSDTAGFAASVAEGGALPFLALALLRGPEVQSLLDETRLRLGDRPWGVGILGFVPRELREEQLEVIRAVRPPFALIAGGRPDQALSLEAAGIPTYLHVPSPALLRMFLESGARRFVFEGRECGGHVGPRSSFALWNAMIDVLLEAEPLLRPAGACHVIFAGGIHDGRSASMVAAMAAPLVDAGIKVGVLLGTAYLFTEEAVRDGAITRVFQDEALACARTALLESGPGHATRCVRTAFVAQFGAERRRLQAEGRSPEEIREALEELNLGRLRIASKGLARPTAPAPDGPRLVALGDDDQRREGMFMIGQVATLRDRVGRIADLHADVAAGAVGRLASRRRPAAAAPRPCDVAIVGMACFLPKAPSVDAFWANILGKVDAITDIPAERFDWRLYFDADPMARDRIYGRWGGFIDPVPFDPARYGMPPSSLPSIEPAQLIALEAVRRALDDAGYATRLFDRSRAGVIIGIGGGIAELGARYLMRSLLPLYAPDAPAASWEALPEWTEDSFAGVILNVTAGRVANRFDLGGVNYTVDAACASALAALYAGVRELETGTADTMIVGGVDTVQNPFGYLCFSKTRALSPRGRCRTFDESADGTVISEGVAMVVLKRLADAERDGDRIYAVIKAVAGSSDGRDRSMTAPRPEGQMLALERAYAAAGVSPASVGLVEAHGTGTVAGDQAEIEALTRAFAPHGQTTQWCAVGSVKSNIGHTKCAAGLAGLIKAAKALHHKVLPPTIGVERPNGRARFAEGPFYVNSEARPWVQPGDEPRRAGVSSFGFGGTNFHAVLEEYAGAVPAAAVRAAGDGWPAELFVIAAPTRGRLIGAVDALAAAVAADAGAPLRRRAAAQWEAVRGELGPASLALAVVAASAEDLGDKLTAARARLAEGAASIEDPRGIYFAEAPLAREGTVAFLFPGQGSQYPDMLRDLALGFEEVRECAEAASRELADRLPEPLARYVYPPPRFTEAEEGAAAAALTQTNVAQPALGAAGLGLFRLLEALGVRPAAVGGHSYGEYVALGAAGVVAEPDLYAISEARGRVIIDSAGAELGTMAAVQGEASAVEAALGGLADVWIANVNSPRQTVISGTHAAVGAAVAQLAAAGLSARPVSVACAFHSPLIAEAGHRLAERLAKIELSPPAVPVFSNGDAEPYPADAAGIAQRLARHLVTPVRFMEQIEAMYAAGHRIFVEVGPRNILTGLARQTLDGRRVLAVATDVPGRPGTVQLLHALGQLAAHGVAPVLDRLFAGRLEGTEPAPAPSPTAWTVTGAVARPLVERALVAPRANPGSAGASAAAPVAVPAPVAPAGSEPVRAAAPATPTASMVPASQMRPGAPAVAPQGAPPRALASGAVAEPAGAYAAGDSGDGAAEVMRQFQQLMSRFLETQQSVMLAYLGGAAAEAALPAAGGAAAPLAAALVPPPPVLAVAPPGQPVERVAAEAPAESVERAPDAGRPPALDAAGLRAELVRIASDRTGYPPEMLDLGANMEADLGIDSIKRVEILGALKQALPAEVGMALQGALETLTRAKTLDAVVEGVAALLPGASAAAVPAPVGAAAAPQLDADAVRAELVRIASDRTGYPPEMLDLDANMEADLGIDSIKRVEILGALKQALPAEVGMAVQGALEMLTRTRTLRGIADAVAALARDGRGAPVAEPAKPAAASRPSPSPASPAKTLTAPTRAAEAPPLPRFLLVPRPEPLGPGAPLRLDGVVVVTEDAEGVAGEVREALAGRGARVVSVAPGARLAEVGPERYEVALEEPAEVARLVSLIRERHGAVQGIVHCAPIERASGDPLAVDVAVWRARAGRSARGLYALARAAAGDIAASAAGFVVAVTSLDGAFGCRAGSAAGHGGVAGLVKSLAAEWPGVRCKAVDVDLDDRPRVGDAVLAELDSGDGALEVGWRGSDRVVMTLVPAPAEGSPVAPPLDPGAVVLITGGARGITAEVAEELAHRYRPTLVLVGQRPLPEAEESPATAGLEAPREIRAALLAALEGSGTRPTPAAVEAAYRALLRDREVRRRIAAMRRAGATVVYRAADVRDPEAVRDLVADVYRAHGRIDGVIHGAGVIEDRLLADKAPESFDRVFDTKAVSAFALARALRPESTRFLYFFSSVAGRFGNRGQADYAAANEVVNKLAAALDRAWPGRVAALGWGPWAGGGMVTDEVARQFAERGIELVDPAAGRAALDAELRHGAKGAAEVLLGRGPWCAAAPAGEPAAAPSPIVAGLRPAGEGPIEFRHDLDLGRDLYLDDHRLDGIPVLPAAMAAELMAELAAAAFPGWEVVGIQGFRLLRGVVLNGGPKPIRVVGRRRPSPPDNGHHLVVDAEIAEDGLGATAYRASVVLGRALPAAPAFEVPAAGQFHDLPGDTAATYREFLIHGPRFQCITRFCGIGPAGIVATVRPSSPATCLVAPHAPRWLIDPIGLDAGPQLAMVWARIIKKLGALPSRIGALRRYRPLHEGGEGHCYFQVDPRSSEQTVVSNVYFVGTDGRLSLVLEGLESTCSPALTRLRGPDAA